MHKDEERMEDYLGVALVPSRNEKGDWEGGGSTGGPVGSRFVTFGFWFFRSCIAALRSSISSTLISISRWEEIHRFHSPVSIDLTS